MAAKFSLNEAQLLKTSWTCPCRLLCNCMQTGWKSLLLICIQLRGWIWLFFYFQYLVCCYFYLSKVPRSINRHSRVGSNVTTTNLFPSMSCISWKLLSKIHLRNLEQCHNCCLFLANKMLLALSVLFTSTLFYVNLLHSNGILHVLKCWHPF